MKALNTMMFINNATGEMVSYNASIRAAEDFDQAKRIGNQALGYINCMITFLNTMICKENNDFTAEFDEVIESWKRGVFQAVADKAIETKQTSDVVWAILKRRDGEE